ncbi:MAG: OmpA family protein [Saprospiraceae bacterium]
MRYLFCVLTLLLVVPSALQSQDFHTIETTNSKAKKKFDDAKKHIQQRQTALAQGSLEQAIQQDSFFVEAWLLMGETYVDLENYHYAELMFQRAVDIAPDFDPLIYYRLGTMEWYLEAYSDAKEHLEIFLNKNTEEGLSSKKAASMLARVDFILDALKNPVPFDPHPLDTTVNSQYDEYFPVLTADGKTLIFTRRIPVRIEEGTHMVISDENFYSSTLDEDGNWQQAVELAGVNTRQNEGAQSISPDGSWLVFTACNRRGDGSQGSCDLYWSQKKETGWTEPRPFSATINSRDWDSHPCISADGKSIYFSSGRKGGQGNADLWVTYRQSDGKWTEPANLGPTINTSGTEDSPFFHPDGKTLYFSSNGHVGMGNQDLFMTRLQDDGSWSKPINLGYPINTKYGEQTMCVALDGKTAYYSVEKEPGKGNIDIVRFTLPEAVRAQPATYLKVRVRDARTGYPIKAAVKLRNLTRDELFAYKFTANDGTLLVCIPAGHDYGMHVSKEGYLFHSEHFSLTGQSSFEKPFLLTIDLEPIDEEVAGSDTPPPAGQPIVLQNVFFETASATLLDASKFELDALRDLLNEHPRLRIRINGHTDSVGSDSDNQTLSENRAASVRQYLIDQGIAADRLESAGFGETAPVADNGTEEGRARNRRTEFEIIPSKQ